MSMSNPPEMKRWQRWRPQDFSNGTDEKIVTQAESTELDTREALSLLDQQTLEALRHAAEKQGYEQGKVAGLAAGKAQAKTEMDECLTQALNAAQEEQEVLRGRFVQLLEGLQDSFQQLDSVFATTLMQIALTAAKQVIGQIPVCDHDVLQQNIQQLLHDEPLLPRKIQLCIHPVEHAFLQQYLSTELTQYEVTLIMDEHIQPGGFRLLSEHGEVDATLERRWRELCLLSQKGDST